MESILDKYELTVERFEGAVAVGRTTSQILAMFNKTTKEMDEWCLENYGHRFLFIYEWVRQCTIDEYLHCIHDLGMRGNPSALGIIDRAIQKDEASQTVKIEFLTQLPEENEEDKEDDEENSSGND